jgi:hypothetical protein
MPASTVTEYLAALSQERRDALNEVRRAINRALPPGYKEGIQFGMISWFVPLDTYPAGSALVVVTTASPQYARFRRSYIQRLCR